MLHDTTAANPPRPLQHTTVYACRQANQQQANIESATLGLLQGPTTTQVAQHAVQEQEPQDGTHRGRGCR